jgi:hypothetical protein
MQPAVDPRVRKRAFDRVIEDFQRIIMERRRFFFSHAARQRRLDEQSRPPPDADPDLAAAINASRADQPRPPEPPRRAIREADIQRHLFDPVTLRQILARLPGVDPFDPRFDEFAGPSEEPRWHIRLRPA